MPRKKITTKKVATKRASKAKEAKTPDTKQANGKNEEEKQRRNIHDLMNTRTTNPFGTSNAEKFEKEMSQMNMNDLQRLAIKVGVIPSPNRTTLKNKLKREFRRYTGGQLSDKAYEAQKQNGPIAEPGTDQAKNIQKLLGT